MPELRFERDEIKEAANRRKHGVTFVEASTAFSDDHALLLADPDHSELEDRFILMGSSSTSRTLVVCHCYRKTRETIRLISARRADRSEQDQYFRRLYR